MVLVVIPSEAVVGAAELITGTEEDPPGTTGTEPVVHGVVLGR
jgi:hypothetical protein